MLQTRIKLQLNTILFRKTLVKKDLAATAKDEDKPASTENITPSIPAELNGTKGEEDQKLQNNVPAQPSEVKGQDKDEEKDEEDVSSKSQIMTLFTGKLKRASSSLKSWR